LAGALVVSFICERQISWKKLCKTHLGMLSLPLWVGAAYVLLGLALLSTLRAQQLPSNGSSIPVPVARIDLSVVGYQGLSRMARLTDEAGISLDFVDREHVLVTFNPKKMVTRQPDCPPEHADRLVHAAVVEVSEGKAVKEADWYLHDHRRYIWSLGSGQFLLRKLNSLYLVDGDLHEKLLMNSPRDLVWVTVTADKKQIIVETAQNEKPTKNALPQQAGRGNKHEFQLDFLDSNSLVVQRTIKVNGIVNLDATSTGYADFIRKGDLYLVRFGPGPEQRQNIARVRSRCVPEVIYPGRNSLLIGRCPLNGNDYVVTAFTVTGHRLWRQHWSQRRYFPMIAGSEDNSRVALSTVVRTDPPVVAANADDGEEDGADVNDMNHGLEQNIQVLETASGGPIQSVGANPVVMSGQNFSLSPDGRRLAVLHNSAIEFYDLPPMSQEAEAKFTALKADVPGLYMVPSKSGEDTQLEQEPGEESAGGGTEAAGGASSKLAPEKQDASNSAHNVTEDATLPVDTGGPVATFKTGTQAVVVDVVVTDGKGHPINGLRQQDFQVEEDGKLQNVHYFKEVNTSQTTLAPNVAPAPPAVTPQPPANVFSNSAQAPDSGSVTLILLDLLNTPSADQDYAREQLIDFLKNKPKISRFALCTLSSSRALYLRLIQGFTPDENLLLAAASGRKAARQAVGWQAAAAGTEDSVNTVRDAAQEGPMGGWGALLSSLQTMQAEQQVTDTDARVGITVDALTQLARYLSGIPGRKNLVWLSGSFPISIPQSADFDNPNSDSRNYTIKFKQATNLLAEAQVAVYPVDVRVQVQDSVVSAGSQGVGSRGTVTASAPGQPVSDETPLAPSQALQQGTMQQLALRSAERETLSQIASDTGGRAFFNSNAIREAITTANEQGSNYYTLSYTPANHNYNGKFRKIKVAAGKGNHLNYRPGYFADDPYAPVKHAGFYQNFGAAAMQHGSPQSRQILFAVRVVPIGVKVKGDSTKAGATLLASNAKTSLPATVELQHYGIDYAVESSDLRFVPKGDDIHHCVLNLVIATFDEDGRQLSGVSSAWTGDLKSADYKDVMSGGVRIRQEIDVPVKAASLRLGINDAASNHLGTIEIPLPVPAPPDLPRAVKRSLPEIEPD
jgi:VWFA-related protein